MTVISDLLQYLVSGIAQGSIYAIVALGFTIIFATTRIVNFAHGEFVMLGAMISYWLCGPQQWPVYLAVPVAVALAVLVGSALGWLLMRPLHNAPQVSLIIITIGASTLIQGVASQLWGKDAVALPPFTTGNPVLIQLPVALTGSADAPPVVIMQQHLWVLGITAVMVITLSLFFNLTLTGKAMRAVAVNRTGATLVGINISQMIIGAFALSAAMGALAGAAIAPISCGYYNMGTMMGLKGFAAAIVGGLGSFPGSIVAGLFLGVLESLGAGYLSSDYKDAFAFIILLLVLFISPKGLPALWQRKAAQ